MTIINPNSIAGITSVTAEAGVMNFYKSDGTLAGLQLNGVNFNTTSGVSTFNNVYVGGTITYEDVKNVDSVGVVTARAGVNISGGNLQVGGTNVINSSRALYNVESVKLADSKNLILGTGDDLKIYHSGSHSFISEEGQGALKVKGDDVRFENASATEALRIDSGGRIGIKNTSPSSQYFNNLVVGDNSSGDWGITIRTNSSNKGVLAFSDSDASDANRYDGYIAYHHSDQSMRFYAAGANERLRITSAGKVGINEDVPQSTLHVASTSNYSDIGLSNSTSGHTGSDGANIFLNNNLELALWNRENSHIRFATNGTERLRITSGGEVLIGTSTGTGNNLTVQDAGTSTTAGANICARFQSNGSGRDATIQLSDNVANSATISMLSSDLIFKQAGTETLRINSSGNMGLGDLSNVSNNPQALLHIASTDPTFRIQDTTNDFYAHIKSDDGGNLILDGDAGNGAGSSYISLRTDGTERVRITNGNVIRFYSPDGNSKGYIYQTNSDNFIVEADTSNSIDGDLLLRAVADGGTIQMVCGGNNERLRITSAGTAEFYGGEGGTDAIKVQSEGGGAGLYFSNFQGITDTGDSTRLGVGKNDNALIWMNASGSQVGCLAYGTTDAVPLVFSTHNTERLRISSTGMVSIGTNNQSSGNANAKLRVGTESGSTNGYAVFGSGDTTIPAIYVTNWDGAQAHNNSVVAFDNSGWGRFDIGCVGGVDAFCIWDDGTQRLRIASDGTVIFKQGSTLTNSLQAYSSEGGYVHHYVARTTSGSDRYRRMLDVAGMGDSTHGGAIRFLTNSDGTANATERMRILPGNGIMVIGNNATITHNQNHIHRDCPGIFTVHSGSGESNRTNTTAGVYAAPTGGFVNYADYELAVKLIDISNSSVNIVMAKNGEPISIDQNRSSWSFYNKLPNYLLGLPCTDCINNTDFTLTLYADFLVFLLRNNGWNSIGTGVDNFPTGWREIEANTNIGPPGANTRLYCKSVSAGTYNNWDNNSAMYFFRLA